MTDMSRFWSDVLDRVQSQQHSMAFNLLGLLLRDLNGHLQLLDVAAGVDVGEDSARLIVISMTSGSGVTAS